jgi:hypothetical protein
MPVAPGALSPGREYPRHMYHATKDAVIINSAREERALGPEWSRKYIHREFPKVKYHWSGDNRTVQSAEEEAALGGGWANDPGAFAAYKGPRHASVEGGDPCQWVDDFSMPGLSSEHRKKIKAHLIRAHAALARVPGVDPESEAVVCMRQAFDAIAQGLYDAGILRPDDLRKIEELVWDSACAGGWWRRAAETPQDIFPEQVGHYWIWREDRREAKQLFRAETLEWTAKLLESPCPENPIARALSPTPADELSKLEEVAPGTSNTTPSVAAAETDIPLATGAQRIAAVDAYVAFFHCPQAICNVDSIS